MALPWFCDISFSIVCFSWQKFIFQASQSSSWILFLFLVLYFNSQKALLLRRISEEGFWTAEAWLSPHWLLRLFTSSRGTLLHLLFSDTPRKKTSYCSTAVREEDKVILLKLLYIMVMSWFYFFLRFNLRNWREVLEYTAPLSVVSSNSFCHLYLLMCVLHVMCWPESIVWILMEECLQLVPYFSGCVFPRIWVKTSYLLWALMFARAHA